MSWFLESLQTNPLPYIMWSLFAMQCMLAPFVIMKVRSIGKSIDNI
jgi:hypothetical protein